MPWLKDWLVLIQQLPQWKNSVRSHCKTDKISITYGVPQESVLGTILFNMCQWPFPWFLTHTVMQYADDTQSIHIGDINDIRGLLNRGEECIAKVKLYFNKNGLMLNAKKTHCMFVGTRGLLLQIPSDVPTLVDENPIFPSNSIKELRHLFRHPYDVWHTDTHTSRSWVGKSLDCVIDLFNKKVELVVGSKE